MLFAIITLASIQAVSRSKTGNLLRAMNWRQRSPPTEQSGLIVPNLDVAFWDSGTSAGYLFSPVEFFKRVVTILTAAAKAPVNVLLAQLTGDLYSTEKLCMNAAYL